jgi:organic radical activating enzyme
MSNIIKTIENFVTWQGEGTDAGKRLLIIRFKQCSRCCPWCDTQVRMRNSIETQITLDEIQKIVNDEKCGIMITGGSPTFGENLQSSINIINNVDCKIFNLETNGYNLIGLIDKVDSDKNIIYSLSPKLFSEEDYSFYIELIPKIIKNEKVYIKLVYEERDLVIRFLDYLQVIGFDNQRIYLMPEGINREQILEHAPKVFDAAEKYKTNFSSRDHIIYGFV